MPDKAGAFLLASRIIAACGGNIARVNYNRAVDTHTLFIEVSATAAQHGEIARQLSECGYLTELEDGKRILMIVLTLPDHPGAVTPVLEVLSRHRVNISYISSQENGTGVQHFKMGLLIENTGEIKRLIDEISRICEISILNYEVTDRLLDGTVFYITFANEMREILSLSQAQTNAVLIQANRLMQLLDEQDKPALKTFDYIRRFAQFVVEHRGRGLQRAGQHRAAGRRPHAHRHRAALRQQHLCAGIPRRTFVRGLRLCLLQGGDAAPARRAVPALFPARQGGLAHARGRGPRRAAFAVRPRLLEPGLL